MIHAGNAIDCTIGVTLGVSTLAAAAVGQIVANTGGILFGETLQRFMFRFSWMSSSNQAAPPLTAAQSSLQVVERARFTGTLLGILLGCVVGLANLLVIDTHWSRDQKQIQHEPLSSSSSDLHGGFPFEIHVSNQHCLADKHQPATTLIIRGPDVDGILAILLTALNEEGYAVLEMSARPQPTIGSHSGSGSNGSSNCSSTNSSSLHKDAQPPQPPQTQQQPQTKSIPYYEDIFVVRRRGEAIPEEELAQLTRKLLQEKLLSRIQYNQHSST